MNMNVRGDSDATNEMTNQWVRASMEALNQEGGIMDEWPQAFVDRAGENANNVDENIKSNEEERN